MDAAGGEVVAPQADARHLQRHVELGRGALGLHRQVVRLGVVEHHADDPAGSPVGIGHHAPVRVDVLERAVGLAHPIAVRVHAGAAERREEGLVEAVFRQDALRGHTERRRARLGRIEAEEPEHMPVPAAFERPRIALPDADAAEVLRHVQQLGQALVLGLQPRHLGLRLLQGVRVGGL